MASSHMLRPLCTSHFFYPSPSSEDRVCCCAGLRGRRRPLRAAFVLSCPRDRSLWSDLTLLSSKLSPSATRIHGVILPRGNLTGQPNAVAEANADAQLSNPLLDAQPVSDASSAGTNGSAAPDPSADPGPDFDYQVYAANTMVGYEPPPPPRIPFGGPFEDYYDEYVGVDYVPKQEKPTSSFLMFLESLNEKRAEEEAKLREKDPSRPPFNPKPNKHLFEGKPLFTIPRPIQPAPVPRDYVPPDPDVNSTPKRIFSPMPPKEERRKAKKPEADTALTEEKAESEVPKSVTLRTDSEVVSSKTDVADTEQSSVEEFSPIGADTVRPSSTSIAIESTDTSAAAPSSAPLSSSSFISPGTLAEEPSFGGRTLSPQSRSSGDATTLSPSARPFETTSNEPLYPSARPFEAPADASGSLFPQTRPVISNEPTSLESKSIEESKPANLEGRTPDEAKEERPLTFQRTPSDESQPFPSRTPSEEGVEEKPVIFGLSDREESRPPVPSSPLASTQGRPLNGINGSGSNLFSQARSFEPSSPLGQSPNTAGTLASQATPFSMNVEASQMSQQVDGMFRDSPGAMLPTSEFYEPNDGDIVLGVVTYADEDELSLEIGGRVPALMTMRDFQPFTEIGANSFFKLPSEDGVSETLEGFSVPEQGKVFLVEDKVVNDGIYRGENVSVGTIVIAEVHSKALVEGRPVLTCRRLARSLGFVRIEQIMRTGEPIEMEISQYNDGGLQGYLEGVRAFLPRSELLRRPESSAALQDYVGKTLRVAILQAEEYSSNVIVSEVKPWMSENLLLGTVHDLVVTRIYPYGMQVEIIGTRVRGFIHISSISRGYVTSVHTFFTEGEQTKGMVIKGKKPGQLSFSIEALEPPNEEGLLLRDKETVYYGAEEIAKGSYEYQLPIEERRIFALRSAATSVTLQNGIANLPWLKLENLRNSSL